MESGEQGGIQVYNKAGFRRTRGDSEEPGGIQGYKGGFRSSRGFWSARGTGEQRRGFSSTYGEEW